MEVLVYIYDRVNWPNFEWDQVLIADILTSVRFLQGGFIDKIESLGFSLQEEAAFQTLTHDVIKTSEIEDEHLDKQQVCSSVARQFGMDTGGLAPGDRHIDGIVEMLLDATRAYDCELTQ